jgi:hypothetical protein
VYHLVGDNYLFGGVSAAVFHPVVPVLFHKLMLLFFFHTFPEPIPIPTPHFAHCQIDLVGPLPVSHGLTHLLTTVYSTAC